VREALILTGGRAELKSYVPRQAILLLAGAALRPAGRSPARRRLLEVVTGFFIACLVGFTWRGRRGGGDPVLPLVERIYSLMLLAQFWSFANDLYTRDQG
jgi:AAA family ATP:ADP antiporter